MFCQACGSKLLLKERYRAIKLIGQGGFGRTFLAVDEDKPSKPPCVIKQFFPQAQGTNNAQKAAELFEQEAVRLDELGKHPQIPELFAHFGQDGRQYLVQEFIEGENLARTLEAGGAFSETQIRDLLNSLLPVLDFVHSHNIIHRDIKPENIILRTAPYQAGASIGELVLVDFGAAKYAIGTALLKTGTTIGTPEYLAPEQSKGKAVFASDLYSLGVTCIHLLTRLSPFDVFDVGEDAWVWRQYLVNNPVSDRLGRVLDKLIENATNKRYQSAAEVLKDLNSNAPQNTFIQEKGKPPVTAAKSVDSISQADAIASSASASGSWNCLHTFSHPGWVAAVRSVAFSPDGERVASASDDKTVKIWNLSTGEEARTLTGHSDFVYSLAISPNGQTLVSGSGDNTIKIWNIREGKESLSITYSFWVKVVTAVAFSLNGQLVASGGGDNAIKLWNPSNGKKIRTVTGHSDKVVSIAFSLNGQIIASASEDKTIKIWDLNTGKELQTLCGHLSTVRAVTFSPDGKMLISASNDKTIKVWNLRTWEQIRTLRGHLKAVTSLAISPDSETLASGSDDKTIKLWDLRTGNEIGTLSGHSSYVLSVAFSPDNRNIASGSHDKTIKIWRRV